MSQIKDAMIKLFLEKELRESLISKGFAQKDKFSWDKTADLLWGKYPDLYEYLILRQAKEPVKKYGPESRSPSSVFPER
jgi:hypothetical protein